jgi:aminoglycoside phosphotransferase family enzyme/predicted kinase
LSSPSETGRAGAPAGDPQAEIVRLLADPATHGGQHVRRIDTHASSVFLTEARAYKLKRAVTYPYLDFGTREKRAAAVAAELRLNRRTAPRLYLGARPVVRAADGAPALGALQTDGPDPDRVREPLLDWLVELRRFDEDGLMDRVAADGRLDAATVDRLADAVADLHARAEPAEAPAGAESLVHVIDQNAQQFAESPDLFPPWQAGDLTARSQRALDAARGLLDRRASAGHVRRCHGDLHLGNVVLIDGQPTLFDAIEFNREIAEIDTLYDLAFLLMDLDRRGLGWAANRLLNRYYTMRADLDALLALPLLMSLRAGIRAHVAASARAGQADASGRAAQEREASTLFAAACDYLAPAPARLVAVGGVSGSGKTTIARRVAPEIGRPPGAVVVRSDVERKRLFGVAETERLPEHAYRGTVNARVYRAMLDRAAEALKAGQSAIVEATFLDRSSRADARKTAEALGVPFQGVWLSAPEDTLKARVDARAADASDATSAVVEGQLTRAPKGEIAWPRVDAAGTPAEVTARALAVLDDG